MESFEALNKCIGKHTREVAKRLRVSAVLVYKYQEPHNDFTDSGSINPIDKLNDIVNVAKECGQGEDAMEPIYFLAAKHGLTCIHLPQVNTPEGVGPELLKVIKEFSDVAQATASALSDNRISPPEAKKIEREGNEAIRAISTLLSVVKESVK